MDILLYSSDMTLINSWKKSIKETCYVVDKFDNITNCLIVIDYCECSELCLEKIKLLAHENKILVLDRTPDIKTAKELLNHGVKGYGNALMREHFLVSAIQTIKDGMIWLYPAFTSVLIDKISSNKKDITSPEVSTLSRREKEVSLLLKDGHTYKEIAYKLGITARTVKAHAQNSYIKLDVKDRLGLALLLK